MPNSACSDGSAISYALKTDFDLFWLEKRF
jgi:hypothetical protein